MSDYQQTTLDDVRAALSCIPAFDRETWVRMGMAVKAEFGDAGFDVWDQWSQSDNSYKEKTAKATWRSFKGGKTAIGSLFHEAKENGYEFKPAQLSDAEKEKRRNAAEQRKADNAARWAREAQEEKEWQECVAGVSQIVWKNHLSTSGTSEYLAKKHIGACKHRGNKFAERGLVVVVHLEEKRIDVIAGKEDISAFFNNYNREDETVSVRYLKAGTIAVPMRDAGGKLWGLQLIYKSGNKSFLKHARKQGLYHIICNPAEVIGKIYIAEGFATAASLYMAFGVPVAVAFDAGNIRPVAEAIRGVYPHIEIIICGDDDTQTTGNPGRTKAMEAARVVGGKAVFPIFDKDEVVA